MRVLLFLTVYLTSLAHAGVIFSIGPSAVTGYKSEAEAPNGKKYFDGTGTLGYNAGVEYPMLRNYLSFNANIFYAKLNAKTQYKDPATGLQIDDQKSYLSHTNALVGAKVRLINMRHLKIFAGAGALFGTAKLRHDKDDYIQKHGALPSNFKEVEKAQNFGHYLEAGTELIFSKASGLRLQAQLLNSTTDKFQTLNKKAINGSYAVYTIQYIHYFEKLLPK
jgi:hypothetical protein